MISIIIETRGKRVPKASNDCSRNKTTTNVITAINAVAPFQSRSNHW